VTKRLVAFVICGLVSLPVVPAAFAQGKSGQDHGKSGGNNAPAANGGGNAGKSSNAGGNGGGGGAASAVSPPSEVVLAAPTSLSGSTSVSTPFAWIDNANLMAPGSVWIGISTTRWQNAGVSQTSFPVVDAAIGMTPRVQIGASVPRIAPSDALGRPAALGTAFFNAKVGVLTDNSKPLKVAIAPTLEVLSPLATQFAPTEQGRVQWGLPVSAEFDKGVSRIYGSSGYFSPGVWFAGAGVGTQIGTRVGVAVSLSRAWSGSPAADTGLPAPRRHDVSTGMSVALTPNVGVFGSVGKTFKTDAQYGAGTSVSVGLSLTSNRIAATQ
jgi:hypothetical protein